jgi:hypothetical protein
MQRLNAILVLVLIVVSLLPLYILYRYLRHVMRPKESMRRFLLWLLTVLALVFVYTFSLVLLIKTLFPGA